MNKTETIHKEFKQALNISTLKPHDLPPVQPEKVPINDLRDFGFVESTTVTKAVKEKYEADVKHGIATYHNAIIDLLKKLEAKYPKYRIISLSRIVSLMKKYNLCFGYVKDYTQIVPLKNVAELKEYEQTVTVSDTVRYANLNELVAGKPRCVQGKEPDRYMIIAPREFFKSHLTPVEGFMLDIPKAKLKFDMPFKEVFKRTVVDTDPIVLRPLNITDNEVFFHIATAWDIEAGDEMVTTKVDATAENNN